MEQNRFDDELNRIRKIYFNRESSGEKRYNILEPSVYMNFQERERALIKWIKFAGFGNVKNLKLLEIGCGYGSNLLEFIKLGFLPENLTGNDLIEERLVVAQTKLPSTVKIFSGDASALNLPVEYYDIVFQSMVFSSVLNMDLQRELAAKMWSLVRPGGGILSYDLVRNNPNNNDIKRLSKKKILSLFPAKRAKFWKVTLAPPVARLITSLNPNLYNVVNMFSFMRTHLLCWLEK